ncbi:response regulator [Myxococcota bacterium]|nr:response regulator [Myxococcota bacterium]MBU1428936.1 response regulator [Myxococcota bacterium]MBU1896971.1 response regulator [Myxococcota bacterium]
MAANINILLIDDDKDICEYVQTVLEATGYAVSTLSDPTQTLDVMRQREYHLLIVDLMMPHLDGISLIEKIRKVDSDIAIIVFTGYPSIETAVSALKLNVSDYIKKPFDLNEFREKIAEVLKKKGLLFNQEEALHKAIGQTIRELRKEQSLTLKQLSRRTSLSVSLLSQIERAESSASVSSLYKIAIALGVKLHSLFGRF